MSNQNLPRFAPTNNVPYLESRLAFFVSLAENAWTPRWRQFWQGQADSIRQELKSKMVNPAVKSVETGE